MGFFDGGVLQAVPKPLPMAARCGECGLYKSCQSPKMPVSGRGKAGILIVGEAPGADEDRENKPFVGKTGKRLRNTLRELGISPDGDCWMTNSAICRPPKNKLPDDAPEHCRPNLLKAIDTLQPRTIILLGKHAVRSLIGFLWKENVGDIGRWVGWRIPILRYNSWVCPTWHPSYVEREESPVLDKLWRRHIERAIKLPGRPWQNPPDYNKQVEVCYDPNRAARLIRRMIGDKPIAFDFETTCLKPDNASSKIYSCSVSDGKTTISFPWERTVRAAMKELIGKGTPMIATNGKFEYRWCLAKMGVRPRIWHDPQLTAHILDNRELITSLKFQAFVLLGSEPYDDHIKPFLKSKEHTGYGLNRIKECDLHSILHYGGLDSLFAWHVTMKQRKVLGYETTA